MKRWKREAWTKEGWMAQMRAQAVRPPPEPRRTFVTAPVSRAGAAAGRRYAPGWLRLAVLKRDGYKCRYCRVEVTDGTANIDHRIPWPQGLTERRNLVTSCRECNREKGRQRIENMRRRRPVRFVRGGTMSN